MSIDAVVKAAMGQTDLAIYAAALYLVGKVKEKLSAPAPRRRVIGQRGRMRGVVYYRALTAASPGAPPRKLSGRLRASVDTARIGPGEFAVGTPVIYGRRHETGNHKFLAPTLAEESSAIEAIIREKL